MNNMQNKLVSYLKEYCFGKDNAISKDRLARYFNITTRELRDLKHDIVINEGIPIGSISKGKHGGYFYAANKFELTLFRGENYSRFISYKEMMDAYDLMILKDEHTEQLRFAGVRSK